MSSFRTQNIVNIHVNPFSAPDPNKIGSGTLEDPRKIIEILSYSKNRSFYKFRSKVKNKSEHGAIYLTYALAIGTECKAYVDRYIAENNLEHRRDKNSNWYEIGITPLPKTIRKNRVLYLKNLTSRSIYIIGMLKIMYQNGLFDIVPNQLLAGYAYLRATAKFPMASDGYMTISRMFPRDGEYDHKKASTKVVYYLNRFKSYRTNSRKKILPPPQTIEELNKRRKISGRMSGIRRTASADIKNQEFLDKYCMIKNDKIKLIKKRADLASELDISVASLDNRLKRINADFQSSDPQLDYLLLLD